MTLELRDSPRDNRRILMGYKEETGAQLKGNNKAWSSYSPARGGAVRGEANTEAIAEVTVMASGRNRRRQSSSIRLQVTGAPVARPVSQRSRKELWHSWDMAALLSVHPTSTAWLLRTLSSVFSPGKTRDDWLGHL